MGLWAMGWLDSGCGLHRVVVGGWRLRGCGPCSLVDCDW